MDDGRWTLWLLVPLLCSVWFGWLLLALRSALASDRRRAVYLRLRLRLRVTSAYDENKSVGWIHCLCPPARLLCLHAPILSLSHCIPASKAISSRPAALPAALPAAPPASASQRALGSPGHVTKKQAGHDWARRRRGPFSPPTHFRHRAKPTATATATATARDQHRSTATTTITITVSQAHDQTTSWKIYSVLSCLFPCHHGGYIVNAAILNATQNPITSDTARARSPSVHPSAQSRVCHTRPCRATRTEHRSRPRRTATANASKITVANVTQVLIHTIASFDATLTRCFTISGR